MRNFFVLCCAFTVVLALPAPKDIRGLVAHFKSAQKTAEQVETLTKTIVSLNGKLDAIINTDLEKQLATLAETLGYIAEIPGAEMYFSVVSEVFNTVIDIMKTLNANGISYTTTFAMLFNALERDIVVVLSKYANKVTTSVEVVKFYIFGIERDGQGKISQENFTKVSAGVGKLLFMGRSGLNMAQGLIKDLHPMYFDIIVDNVNKYVPLAGTKLSEMLAQLDKNIAASVKVIFENIAKDFVGIMNILVKNGNSPYDILFQIVQKYIYDVLRVFNDLAFLS